MLSNLSFQDVIDRAEISDVVIKYATALDRHDWGLMRSILSDPVAIDYSSFDPDLDLEMPAAEWIDRIRGLEGFDATQHISANHVHILNGDEATCVSYMQAAHFLNRPDGQHACVLYGYYTNRLIRTDAGWKIRKCALMITASHGESRIFEWAFNKARAARAAAGEGAQ